MKNIKTWKQINELHSDTYNSAARKSNSNDTLDIRPNLKEYYTTFQITEEDFMKWLADRDTSDLCLDVFDTVMSDLFNPHKKQSLITIKTMFEMVNKEWVDVTLLVGYGTKITSDEGVSTISDWCHIHNIRDWKLEMI